MKKRISLVVSTLIFLSMVVFGSGCSNSKKNNDNTQNNLSIESLYFVSATGNIDQSNCFYISENEGNGIDFSDWDTSNLGINAAEDLIEEITNLPDSDVEDGNLAYHIILVYDDGNAEKEVEKIGYETFPENWKKIINLTNEVLDGAGEVSDSTNVVKIDEEHLRKYWYLDSAELPYPVTADDLINDIPLTYETLYNPKEPCNLGVAVNDYLLDYFDLRSHLIKELSPVSSSSDELLTFADERLDKIDENGQTVSISNSSANLGQDVVLGTCHSETFVIFRSDRFDSWMKLDEDRQFQYDADGYISYLYEKTDGLEEGMSYSETMDIYVDSSGKFVILTSCNDFGVVADVVK